MTPVILYRSRETTNLQPQGQPRRKFMLPPQSGIQFKAYSFDQDYTQRIDQFPPFPKNTVSTSMGLNDANAILTACSQPKDKGAAIGEFTATFSLVPASWSDFRMLPFTFPGFPGLLGEFGRDIFSDNVLARVQYDYFVLDPDNIISTCSAGYPSPASILDSAGNSVTCVYQLGDIPINARTFFVVALSGIPDFTNRTNSITPIGGINVNGVTYYQSLPSLANYKTWIANSKSNAWNSTVWNGTTDAGSTTGQLIAEDSSIQDYSGNIVARATIYILAK